MNFRQILTKKIKQTLLTDLFIISRITLFMIKNVIIPIKSTVLKMPLRSL